jgi:hypothetical protein
MNRPRGQQNRRYRTFTPGFVEDSPLATAIAVFPRKSSRFNHFLDRAIWLLLAPDAQLWVLAGTISGTASTAVDPASLIVSSSNSMRI